MAVHDLASIFGILGNVVSFLVYLAPLPTFYRIIKRKSTEGFQSIPYSVALFSAMLTLYYALLKTDNKLLLIIINAVGIFIETNYLFIYMYYATREAKIFTTKLLLLFNIGTLGLIVGVTHFFFHGHDRVSAVGWICAGFSLCVFAAPLSVMRLVIRTRSAEYMPFSLSFSLTLCAVVWFVFGFLISDYYIATPNILGFVFGVAQMILYGIYKDRRNQVLPVTSVNSVNEEPKMDLLVIVEMQAKEGVNVERIEIVEENEAGEMSNESFEPKV